MNAATIAIVLLVGIVVGVAILFQRNRSLRLRQRFGPEYSRAVAENRA